MFFILPYSVDCKIFWTRVWFCIQVSRMFGYKLRIPREFQTQCLYLRFGTNWRTTREYKYVSVSLPSLVIGYIVIFSPLDWDSNGFFLEKLLASGRKPQSQASSSSTSVLICSVLVSHSIHISSYSKNLRSSLAGIQRIVNIDRGTYISLHAVKSTLQILLPSLPKQTIVSDWQS